jgi:hypothetical protein
VTEPLMIRRPRSFFIKLYPKKNSKNNAECILQNAKVKMVESDSILILPSAFCTLH